MGTSWSPEGPRNIHGSRNPFCLFLCSPLSGGKSKTDAVRAWCPGDGTTGLSVTLGKVPSAPLLLPERPCPELEQSPSMLGDPFYHLHLPLASSQGFCSPSSQVAAMVKLRCPCPCLSPISEVFPAWEPTRLQLLWQTDV